MSPHAAAAEHQLVDAAQQKNNRPWVRNRKLKEKSYRDVRFPFLVT